jgi:hypothetical protein
VSLDVETGHLARLFAVLVSVVIPNFNYARFLPEAIESVLSQTYPRIETIVVDDGSVDNSREVIASYGDRVISVFKNNGGLTSALNAGFQRTAGDLISFLDADDAFEPEKIDRVVAAARRVREAYLIHHQMQMVDESGKAMHRPFPARVPDGDIRALVARTGGWFPRAVMSGLTFTRTYSQRLFPMPEEQHFVYQGQSHVLPVFETYLAAPAALCAPVAGIQAPLTRYRLHASNMTYATRATAEGQLLRYRAETETLRTVMREKFGDSRPLQMQNHLEYQLLRYAAGETSWAYTIRCVMRSPFLPAMLKVREALRVSMKRGTSASE